MRHRETISICSFLMLLLTGFTSISAQLVPGTAPAMPVRGVGVNEGFADLPGFSLGQATTATVADLSQRGFHVVKIWPLFQSSAALSPVFTDPNLKVIVYRPFKLPTSQVTECGSTGYWWENSDYGAVAADLYQRYGNQEKIVILTGWESDNQINHLPVGNPTCGWPVQAEVTKFTQMLNARQVGVRLVREMNPAAKLRVYHAVDLRTVPDTLTGNNNVLEKIIPNMSEKPDFISYSAWSAPPAKIATRLTNIMTKSGLPKQRIFVSEWGCAENSGTRAACFQNHATNSFNWGVRLWIPWSYSAGGGGNGTDLVDGITGLVTPNGFSVLQPLNASWYAILP